MPTFTKKTYPMQLHTMISRLCFAGALFLLSGLWARVEAQLNVLLNSNFTICEGQVVTLFPEVFGGVQPYTFSWTPAANLSCNDCQAPDVFVSVTTTYEVTVVDAVGDQASAITVITVLPPVIPTLSVIQPQCSLIGGSITASATGGAGGPYIYQWSNGATGATIGNILPPGEYCVTVVDAFGCAGTACATIFPSGPFMTITADIDHASCYSSADGSITPIVTGGVPPYSYLWSTGITTPVLQNVPQGSYTLIVTDAAGCTQVQDYFIGSDLVVDASFGGFIDCNTGTTTLFGVVFPTDDPNVTWEWTGPNNFSSTDLTPTVSAGGEYTLTATNSLVPGCSSSYSVTVSDYNDILVDDMTVNLIGCNTYQLSGIIPANYSGPIAFEWTLPDGTILQETSIIANQTGVYNLRSYIPGQSCESHVARFIDLGLQSCAELSGRVVNDVNEDCFGQPVEAGLSGWVITAASTTDTFHVITNSLGEYNFSLPLGTYTITADGPSGAWDVCPLPAMVLANAGQQSTLNIPVKAIVNCPEMSVTLSSPLLRRCFSSSYYVTVCNNGTEVAFAPQATLSLDAFLTYQSATINPSTIDGQNITFNLPDLEPGECTSFHVFVLVSCDAVLGQTHCSEVSVTPDPLCAPGAGNWSGASLELRGECDADQVRFYVRNNGSGALQQPVNYIVIEDVVMLNHNPGTIVDLPADEETSFTFPANGSTYIFSLEQAEGHPYEQLSPTIAIEGCGVNNQGTFSTGWTTQFPLTTTTLASDILCMENIGAYDPNDKSALPTGYGTKHYLKAGEEIHYLIRFQNTGTDTAFTVVIRDELSPWLDMTSLRRGNSSHNHRLDIQGDRTLVFSFDNILLPDSSANQAASNGFVDFFIRTKEDTPLETRLENKAAIYFDFNEPVITNTVFHTIGENFVEVATWVNDQLNPGMNWKVFPNPASGPVVLELDQAPAGSKILVLTDQHGREVRRITFDGNRLSLTEPLPAGWYALRLLDAGGRLMGSGKLIAQ